MRLDRDRLLRLVRRAGLRGQLLPRGGRRRRRPTWRILLDLGSGALGPLQRTPSRGRARCLLQPPPPRPLPRPVRLRRAAQVPPRRRPAARSRSGARGGRGADGRAYDLPDPGMARVRLPRVRGTGRARPVLVEPFRVAHPVPAYGLRVTADGHTLGLLRRHRPCPALDRSPPGPTCCWPRRRSATASNPDDLHLTGRGRRGRGPQRRTPAGADARPAVVRADRVAEAPRRTTASSLRPSPARTSTSESVRSTRRRGPRSRSAPGW